MNNSLYWAGYFADLCIGLMATPPAHAHSPPVSNLTLTQDGMQVHLDWATLAGAEGYYIYKKTTPDEPYTLLNQSPITDPHYTDPCVDEGGSDIW